MVQVMRGNTLAERRLPDILDNVEEVQLLPGENRVGLTSESPVIR